MLKVILQIPFLDFINFWYSICWRRCITYSLGQRRTLDNSVSGQPRHGLQQGGVSTVPLKQPPVKEFDIQSIMN